MAIVDRPVRVGIYGAGGWANRTHIPNLLKIDGVEIVAISDVSEAALQDTAAQFAVGKTYTDAHQMLDNEALDALYSVVPAFARSDVEARAAAAGVHLFSEKPQAMKMAVARRIADAVDAGGVLSTVCFRERYRPIFQRAKELLADKKIAHIRFQSWGGLPPLKQDAPQRWSSRLETGGSSAFDWGVHAVDYSRYMSGLNVVQAQGFIHHPEEYALPLSCSFSYAMDSGATMHLSFVSAQGGPSREPYFLFFFEGGYLGVHGYRSIELDGETVYRAEEYDPWFEQDRIFIEAVRQGDGRQILNDYRDGLYSLAPVLAAFASGKAGGAPIDVDEFVAA